MWKTLDRPVTLKPLTVVAEHSVFGSGPHKACPILKEHFDGGIGQSVFRSVVAETVLLRLSRHSESHARQSREEGRERCPQHGSNPS